MKVVVRQTFSGIFTCHVGDGLAEVAAVVEVLELAVVGDNWAWFTPVQWRGAAQLDGVLLRQIHHPGNCTWEEKLQKKYCQKWL